MGLHKPTTTIWYAFTALLVLAMGLGSDWFSGFAFGFFLGVEILGVIDPKPGDTYTEFTRWKVTNKASRFVFGLSIAVIAFCRFPDALNEVAAVLLAVWLPAHFAWPGIEERVWRRIGGREK